ncbi:hypothetical protein FHU23_002560 [Clostridium saccharobutylicum]|nr:hypothetical protein CLOSC_31530 [Clostridium saccharobutylicum]AQS01332.1 hypothetical protein CSACC_31600 [Clostridium saccharobutylicum]AQS15315.1 hypothetical protein CLOSACC_31600 [Clostridium saccharobutylicum]MBA2905808.1 hypothetical protein [Clostridium saccharobutylicum]MBA8790452.1 hypothetical protein [Clostridium saccharobutylicum]
MFMLFGVVMDIPPPAFKFNPAGLVKVTLFHLQSLHLMVLYFHLLYLRLLKSLLFHFHFQYENIYLLDLMFLHKCIHFFLTHPVNIGSSLLSFRKYNLALSLTNSIEYIMFTDGSA